MKSRESKILVADFSFRHACVGKSDNNDEVVTMEKQKRLPYNESNFHVFSLDRNKSESEQEFSV